MGHFHDTVQAEGINKRDAEYNAVADFLRENGSRYDVREVSKAKLIKRVPPKGVIETRGGVVYHDYTKRNDKAPQKDWLEVWEFEIHSHA